MRKREKEQIDVYHHFLPIFFSSPFLPLSLSVSVFVSPFLVCSFFLMSLSYI